MIKQDMIKILDVDWSPKGNFFGRATIRIDDIVISNLRVMNGKYGVFISLRLNSGGSSIFLSDAERKSLNSQIKRLFDDRTYLAKPIPKREISDIPSEIDPLSQRDSQSPTSRYLAWKQKARDRGEL